jgi:hypothetical protein
MRATAFNTSSQEIEIYVLAEQRVLKQGSYGEEEPIIARPVLHSDVTPEGALATLIDRPYYLTGFAETISNPQNITGDYHFTPTDPGQPFARPRYTELDLAFIMAVLALTTFMTTLSIPKERGHEHP